MIYAENDEYVSNPLTMGILVVCLGVGRIIVSLLGLTQDMSLNENILSFFALIPLSFSILVLRTHYKDRLLLNSMRKDRNFFKHKKGTKVDWRRLAAREGIKKLPPDVLKIVCDYHRPPKVFDARLDKFADWFTKSNMEIEIKKEYRQYEACFYNMHHMLIPKINGEKITFIVPGMLEEASAGDEKYDLHCIVDVNTIDAQYRKLVCENMDFIVDLPRTIGLKDNTFSSSHGSFDILFHHLKEGVEYKIDNRIHEHVIVVHGIRPHKDGCSICFEYTGVYITPTNS